jgi:multidrug resistance efflux pump
MNNVSNINKLKLTIIILAVIIFVFFSITVWPTFYRYDHIPWNDNIYTVRIHRITGHIDMLTIRGWRTISKQEQ